MFLVTFAVIFLVLAGACTLLVLRIGEAIKRQAQKPVKRFFAPIPRPGSFSFPALEGKVVDIIENVSGWRTAPIPALGDAKCFVISPKEKAGLLEERLGVRWIGLYETIKIIPDWEWSKLKQVETVVNGEKTLKYVIEQEKKPVSEFFFQFPYPVTLEGAEIKGNLRMKIIALFTVLHFHPERAFFLNEDPVTLFNAMVLSALRSYVLDKSFDEVKAIRASVSGGGSQVDTFWQVLKDLNGVVLLDNGTPDYNNVTPLGLFDKLGYVIARGEVLQVEATGPVADALEAEQLAELEGNAKIKEEEKAAIALVVAAQGRMDAAERDAIAQRTLNEQNAGYFASLQGGSRMFAAAQVSGKDSSVSTWVESREEVPVTMPLPLAPPKANPPQRVTPTKNLNT
ncbi:MAG: hypothetical protein AAB392_03270 [Patescibacteria group bacterium]